MKTILITRPIDQAQSLYEKLTRLNFKPIIFPAIAIKPISFDADLNLNKFNIIIFISPAAITHFSHHIKKLPPNLTIFTIGENSAHMIEELQWPKAVYPKNHFSQENLVALPELQAISGQSILIIDGKTANDDLKVILESRGARVSRLAVYERTLPQPKALPSLDAIDIIVSTSQESLRNLVTLLGPTLKTKKLLVSSQKLVDLAATLGFTEKPLLAQNAGDNAIIQALPISA